MIYKFNNELAVFTVKNPHKFNLYFPLTNQDGSLLSCISPNLAGDIKKDNERFLTLPASIEDIRNNLLCRREFFLRINKKIIRLSYPGNDILEAGLLYHKIKKQVSGLEIEIVNFIPHSIAAEVMWIRVINKAGRNIKITPTSFIPLFGRSERNLRDHRHVSSLLNRVSLSDYGIYLKPSMIFDEKGHKINKTIYYVLGFEDKAVKPVGQFPTLDLFCGEANIISPDAIRKNVLPVKKESGEFNGKEACAAFRFREKILKKSEEVNYFLIMGIDESKEKIDKIFNILNSPIKIKNSLEDTKQYWQKYLSQLEFSFKDVNYDNWLRWVKLQPTLRKLFGCSFLPHFDYGKGGRGWRDLWQDALALLLVEPRKARDFIFNSFKGVRIDGSNATIITKEGNFISDRNKISRVWMDHGVWPYLTLRLYLNKTGDIDFLLEEVTYFKDQQLNRAKSIDADFRQNNFILRDKNNRVYKGSILEHFLLQNLVPFFNVGTHNIISLENADWNDGLDMAAERGESAAFSFMYAHNLNDFCNFLRGLRKKTRHVVVLKEMALLLDSINKPINYKNYSEKQKRLEEYFAKTRNISGEKININIDKLIDDLTRKSEHLFNWLRDNEWLNAGFFNGYYDNQSKRVEGNIKGKTRMMLASQVFAMMSGGATEEQVKTAWGSIKKHLKDKKGSGGFRLNTDFGSVCLDFGRAFGFSYGDKENGAFFNHMVVMLANALYKSGFREEGFEALNSIYKMATALSGKIYPVIPEYFNNEGRGQYLYLTGSASWYIYTLMEEVLGIKFVLGDIVFEPKLIPANFSSNDIEIKFMIHGSDMSVKFIKPAKSNKTYTIKEAFFNDKQIPPIDGSYIIRKNSLKNKQNTATIYLV